MLTHDFFLSCIGLAAHDRRKSRALVQKSRNCISKTMYAGAGFRGGSGSARLFLYRFRI